MTTIISFLNMLFAATIPVTHISGYAAGVGALVVAWPYRRPLLAEPAVAALGLMIVYSAVRTIVSSEPAVGWGAVYGYIAHWVLPLLLGYLAGRAVPALMPRLITVLSAGFMALFAVTFTAYLGLMPGIVTIPGLGEFVFVESGLFKGLHSHIALAALCLILIFVHAHLWVENRRPFSLAVIGVCVVVLVLTGSRGYYIAAIVSGAAFALWHAVTRRKYKQLFAGIGLAAAVAVLAYAAVPTLRARIHGAGPQDNNVRERLALYSVAVSEIKDRPLTGFGPGQGIRQSAYFARLEPDMRGVGRHPHLHSFYLNLLADTGFIGCMLFAAIIVTLLRRLWRAGAGGPSYAATLGRGLFWAFIGVLVGDCFDTLLLGPRVAMELFWLAGLAMGGTVVGKDRS